MQDCDSDGYCADPIQVIPVEQIIAHPQYNKRQYTNDIGLLRLQWDANFNPDSVRPICLPLTIEQQSKTLTSLRITGWGKTETGSVSDVLLQANLNVINNNECERLYQTFSRVSIIDTHLCAKGKNSDSCSGDSGGPAIVPANTPYGSRFVQYGVVSFGVSVCTGLSNLPGIYTRVASYMDWILNSISP